MDKNKKKPEQQEKEQESIDTKQEQATDKKVVELEAQIKLFEDKWKRAMADYRNLENRMNDQRGEWIRSSNRELLLRLLPIYDTLQMAHQHTQDKTLAISIAQFQDILKSEGVVKFETIGKEFDPHMMEAIAAGEGEENRVTDELRVGFMIYDKVLRAAQVKVGKKSSN